MTSGAHSSAGRLSSVRRAVIFADESANWKVAGLRQLDRLALSLQESLRSGGEPLIVSVMWAPETPPERRWLPNDSRLDGLLVTERAADEQLKRTDLVLSTRLLVFRNSFAQMLVDLPQPDGRELASGSWDSYRAAFENRLSTTAHISDTQPWRYLRDLRDLPACERAFLRASGKSQDGLVSRHVNRPLSRLVSRLLLHLPILPNTWSVTIFMLPLWACLEFLRGTDPGFFIGCAIYQLYSILDGCDGEIARAKFLQTDFGRRLDSVLDLAGNILLALCLGIGLARYWNRTHASGWFFVAEGITAAISIGLSEGIVFVRRSRGASSAPAGKWNGALYQRHHEFLERSGILVIGETFAWWLVQLTKRDMAMLAFLFLAAVGLAPVILHLLLIVSGTSALLAGGAFLRQPAAALPQEAS